MSIPEDLTDRYGDWRWEQVYQRQSPLPTYRLSPPGTSAAHGDRYVKLKPVDAYPRLPDEAMRMRWAAEFLPVPQLVEYGSDGDVDWLITEALPGVDAAAHPWRRSEPARLVTALAEGLRAFHEAVPVDECPYEFTPLTALAHARSQVRAGLVPTGEQAGGQDGADPAALLAELERTAPADSRQDGFVVTHGAYRLQNVLLIDGRVSGYLDLGRVAVADPWLDLVTGAWSCSDNLGPGYEELFFQAYGVQPDPDRMAWYRLLHRLSY